MCLKGLQYNKVELNSLDFNLTLESTDNFNKDIKVELLS